VSNNNNKVSIDVLLPNNKKIDFAFFEVKHKENRKKKEEESLPMFKVEAHKQNTSLFYLNIQIICRGSGT
jgi:hypothetical protein